jgi:hypothetical protein
MLKKQNGLDNKTEAALINKDIISEIINQNKGIDFAINSNVTFDAAKQNYKKVLNWTTKPSYQDEEAGQVVFRANNNYKEIDFDLFKHLPREVAEKIKTNFPSTMEFGRNADGHAVYKIINPIHDTKRIYLGDKCLLEYRGLGTYSIAAGKLDNYSKATFNGISQAKEIEDKKLYKLFQYAAALAQLYLITSKHETWNNVIISYAGECKEHGLDLEFTKKIFTECLELHGREDREKETIKSIEGIYNSEGNSNIFSKIYSIPIEDAAKHHIRELLKSLTKKEIEPLEVQRYNSDELPQKRKFLIESFCALGNVTSIAAAAGSGKTTAASLLAYCVCTGIQFLGRNVYETGNVLMITNEETINEMQLKLKAVEMEYGNIFDAGMETYNIDFRTIEDVTKLAEFNTSGAKPTDQFKQLEKIIEKNKYKLIVLDPLISLKKGVFDENSNDNMETLIRDFVVNLATKYNVAVTIIHHANKSSAALFEEVGGKYIIDNVQMLNLARGASALGGAVRFAFSMVPMPQVVWEKQYEEIAKDQYSRNNLVGLFDAKANYAAIAEELVWLDKVLKQVPTVDDKTEEVITLRVSDINQLSDAAYESFKANNMKKVVALAPHIKNFFKLNNEKITAIEQGKLAIKHEPLNNLATYLAQKDPEFQNGTVKEATIKSRIKRLLMAACENANGVQLPNTNVYFKYWYDNYESKTKHKVTVERSDEDNPF